jgi:N-hydroxyarylamine O-acetyltransferase
LAFALSAYLDRIGWSGAPAPTLDTLSRLLSAHMQAIPFENLDVLLGRPVRLDLDAIAAKLVDAGRGGYCFEHAALFAHVLEALGFDVARHSARVTLVLKRHQVGRLHMFLTVGLPEGVFVVDPGFGGPAALLPLPLTDAGAEGPTGATHWMARDGDLWVLRTVIGGEPRDAWVSTLERDHPADFIVANHYTATHPASPFVNRLMLSRFTPEGRVSVMNRDATIRTGAETRTFPLADRAALRAFIGDHLGFDFPSVADLRVPFIPEWS